jgi:hypothetical protein
MPDLDIDKAVVQLTQLVEEALEFRLQWALFNAPPAQLLDGLHQLESGWVEGAFGPSHAAPGSGQCRSHHLPGPRKAVCSVSGTRPHVSHGSVLGVIAPGFRQQLRGPAGGAPKRRWDFAIFVIGDLGVERQQTCLFSSLTLLVSQCVPV